MEKWIRTFAQMFAQITGVNPLSDMSDHDWHTLRDMYDTPDEAARIEAARFVEDPEAYDEDTFFANA